MLGGGGKSSCILSKKLVLATVLVHETSFANQHFYSMLLGGRRCYETGSAAGQQINDNTPQPQLSLVFFSNYCLHACANTTKYTTITHPPTKNPLHKEGCSTKGSGCKVQLVHK